MSFLIFHAPMAIVCASLFMISVTCSLHFEQSFVFLSCQGVRGKWVFLKSILTLLNCWKCALSHPSRTMLIAMSVDQSSPDSQAGTFGLLSSRTLWFRASASIDQKMVSSICKNQCRHQQDLNLCGRTHVISSHTYITVNYGAHSREL